ncbi:MAG: cob(I)yrinic acid a,c-diamide adenosyltransferase [Acidimicrobiales bacterium]
MKVYTKAGDDGTTGLFYGGRVDKDDPRPVAYGSVDEAQAAVGLARAAAERGSELDDLLVAIMRDLWVLMAELATADENQHKLEAGTTLTTSAMVDRLETLIDDLSDRFEAPTEFVVPGQTEVAARLDLARTAVRRAEREVIPALKDSNSESLPYLNRLSDLLWTMARWQEGESLATRDA